MTVELQIPAEANASQALSINERVERLRAALKAESPSLLHAEWGNFANEWGQGGGFDNTYRFENGY